MTLCQFCQNSRNAIPYIFQSIDGEEYELNVCPSCLAAMIWLEKTPELMYTMCDGCDTFVLCRAEPPNVAKDDDFGVHQCWIDDPDGPRIQANKVFCCEDCRVEFYQDFYAGMDPYDLIDGVGFADPGGNSALRAATPDNPRDRPCPTCHTPNVLTRIDVQRGYQCNACADALERGY